MLDVAKPDNVKTTDYRPKDFLDPTEIRSFLGAARAGRQGVRDHLLFLMMYRHGLRCSEAVDLRRDDVSLDRATLWAAFNLRCCPLTGHAPQINLYESGDGPCGSPLLHFDRSGPGGR